MIRKIPKIHTDKFTDDYIPEFKPDNQNNLLPETISQEQIDKISQNIIPAWKNCTSGTKYSRLLGQVYDNIYKCPKSEYNYLYNLSERLKIMNGSNNNASEISLSCKDYLKKINVEVTC